MKNYPNLFYKSTITLVPKVDKDGMIWEIYVCLTD